MCIETITELQNHEAKTIRIERTDFKIIIQPIIVGDFNTPLSLTEQEDK